METTPLSAISFDQREPIPGYKITTRLGAGGYGEVWKCEAPGGLFKAVKFVYGTMNDARASREMKSLNRIKEVHHPLLLSLERIEVIDGHLIIVTELADNSLKDRFDECKREGLPGIPRDELLIYLRDTADALDYIYENHSLQHLDVKPENLLLLGKRVKVADFGLLKDLHETSASMVGGMTPLYAPPELFDGRPNRNSDQYSLAMVYQEMLTGEPPFNGSTTAQLAAQHIHSSPTLSTLPKSDQAVIAKALSKDPDKRFPNCRSMVERLLNPDRMVVSRESGPTRSAERRSRRRQQQEDTQWQPGHTPTPLLLPPGKVKDLAPLDLSQTRIGYEPTLFIGIGGMAGKTLRRLRQRLHDRFGDLDEVPFLQMLVVDTDVQDLSRLTQPGKGVALRDRETLPIPLRPPAEYRSDSKRLLESISRRWIYNIPRSLQTEGVRPLGRLAFVDHFDSIFARLQAAVLAATDLAAVQKSEQTTGLRIHSSGAPHIYILASIGGGTGSGVALDLTYAVRQVLLDLGMPDDNLCGIFAHATSRKASARDLAIASGHSFLRELQHFGNVTNFFPGDAGCGLPAFHDNNCPYRDAYLLHLGDELSSNEFDAATDAVAEYLYRDSVTPARAFFKASREEEHAETSFPLSEQRLRTFWLSRLGNELDETPWAEADRLCAGLLAKWCEDNTSPQPFMSRTSLAEVGSLVEASSVEHQSQDPVATERKRRVGAVCAEYLVHRGLDLENFAQIALQKLQQETGCDPEAHLTKLVEEASSRSQTPGEEGQPLQARERCLRTIDNVIGVGEQANSQSFEPLQAVLKRRLRELAASQALSIQEWIVALFNATTTPIKDAQGAAQWFIDELSSLEEAATSRVKAFDEQAGQLARSLLAPAPAPPGKDHRKKTDSHPVPPPFEQEALTYARLRRDQAIYGVAYEIGRAIRNQVAESSRDLKLLESELRMLERGFRTADAENDGECPILRQLNARRSELVGLLHKQTTTRIQATSSLFLELTSNRQNRDALIEIVKSCARVIALDAVKEANLNYLLERLNSDDPDVHLTIEDCLRSATPKLLHCGGNRRLLLVVPENEKGHQLLASLVGEGRMQATLLPDAAQDVLLCCEVTDLPLAAAAGLLVGSRHYCVEVAHRLRSRIDVEWSAISQP